ncbi:tetratricopeptide repeat protein [Sinorhizobium sp. A49]|uniref:tetratricopeptide repeat protein n=1 Tax=Sinorhizobium sp. A49 TaxID=1945861 RepID=UPI000986447E|nr:tetratricopeptide repeat protein [Sinorhizobium sp. A49]
MIQHLWTWLRAIFAGKARRPPALADPPPPGATTIAPRLIELAKGGNVDAQAALGEHFFGDSEENLAAAYHWNGLAARGGHIGAQGRLATIYHEGLGVERNPKEAFRWWHSAALQDHYGAQMMIAAAYELGIVVEADLEEAAYWVSRSYFGAGDRPEALEFVGAYYESVIRKLSEEQRLRVAERLRHLAETTSR